MQQNTYEHVVGQVSTYVAIISFLLGTALYVAFDLTQNGNLLAIGLIYVCLAIVINLAVVLNLVMLWATQRLHRKFFLVKIGIVLANIPIALLYLYLLNYHEFLLHF
jgi:hypothetical protein